MCVSIKCERFCTKNIVSLRNIIFLTALRNIFLLRGIFSYLGTQKNLFFHKNIFIFGKLRTFFFPAENYSIFGAPRIFLSTKENVLFCFPQKNIFIFIAPKNLFQTFLRPMTSFMSTLLISRLSSSHTCSIPLWVRAGLFFFPLRALDCPSWVLDFCSGLS